MEEGFLDLLSEIPGVGKERARRLVSEGFSTVDSILSGNVGDIARAAGIGLELATELREFFRNQFLQDSGPFLCSVCGNLTRSEEAWCPSCGAVMLARKEVEVKSPDSLLAETEKDVRVADEDVLGDIDRLAEEEPKTLAKDWLDRWKRVREGEQVPSAQKIEEQISHCDILLEVDPTSESTWLKKAKLLLELRRNAEAIECCDKASELNPELEEQYKLQVLGALGSKEDLSLDPEPVEDTEAIERAIRHYDGLLRLDPSYKMAWQTKGELLEKLGRHEKAIDCYGEAIRYATLERIGDLRNMATLSQRDIWSRRSISRSLVDRVGRSNGLVNGLVNGRINGLINGFANGKINGLINGFVNGVGRVNGLVNGLINGNGFINGKARRVRFMGIPEGPTRWSKGLVGVAVLLTFLMLVPMLGSILFAPVGLTIEIDGNFDDWSDLSTRSSPLYFDDSLDQLENADVNIVSYRLFRQLNLGYLYAEVEGSFFSGTGQEGLDNLFLLIDSDGNSSTGYVAGDLGVDDLVHLSGWNNSCTRGSFMEFSPSRGRDNWHGFRPAGSAGCAVKQN
ncbi:MAG: hypothetical protein KAS60_02770, partial [Thermoplasmata archaeon]|nr:hypothetical protein [Thermoplasmata archaeon]